MTGNNNVNFIVDKDGGSSISNNTGGSAQTGKLLFRNNRKALEDAFKALKPPARTIRRVR